MFGFSPWGMQPLDTDQRDFYGFQTGSSPYQGLGGIVNAFQTPGFNPWYNSQGFQGLMGSYMAPYQGMLRSYMPQASGTIQDLLPPLYPGG